MPRITEKKITVDAALVAYRRATYKTKAETLYAALEHMELFNGRTKSWCIAKGYADVKGLDLVSEVQEELILEKEKRLT